MKKLEYYLGMFKELLSINKSLIVHFFLKLLMYKVICRVQLRTKYYVSNLGAHDMILYV